MRKTMIRCPNCGWEYLPAEIYYDRAFIGTPKEIIRDANGTIVGFDGEDMDTEEEYICDNCHKSFKIDAVVTFKTTPIKDIFEEEDF